MMPAQSRGAACSSSSAVGQPVGERLVGDAAVGIAAVDVPAGESGMRAEVLVAATAVAAGLVGAGQPGDADPIADPEPVGAGSAGVHVADDLVAGGDLRAARRQVALGEMQVGAAHPAAGDADPDLSGPRYREFPFDPAQWLFVDRRALLYYPSLHRAASYAIVSG